MLLVSIVLKPDARTAKPEKCLRNHGGCFRGRFFNMPPIFLRLKGEYAVFFSRNITVEYEHFID